MCFQSLSVWECIEIRGDQKKHHAALFYNKIPAGCSWVPHPSFSSMSRQNTASLQVSFLSDLFNFFGTCLVMWACSPSLAVRSICEWTLHTQFGGIQMKLIGKNKQMWGTYKQDKWRFYQRWLISTVQNSLFSIPLIAKHPSYTSASASNCKSR